MTNLCRSGDDAVTGFDSRSPHLKNRPVHPDGLEKIPLFAALGEDERRRLAEAAEVVAVPAGERLILEGDFGYQFFAITEGLAEVTHEGTRVGDLGPGDVFGEIALLVTGRRTASVTALTPMRLIVLFDRNFRQVERLVPEFGRLLRAESWSRLKRADAADSPGEAETMPRPTQGAYPST